MARQCSEHEGKGLGRVPTNASTFYMRNEGDDEARAFWRAEYNRGNVRQYLLSGTLRFCCDMS